MSKANLNNSTTGMFMKTHCLSGDPVFAQFHVIFRQFAVQRNEHILTKIVQNELFLQKWGIDTKL